MTDIMYTKSQSEAIHTRGRNVLVSAAAGSGKTRVLVDRIVSFICEEEIPLRKMLVVTFTNAAAGEMKERLAQGLQDALAKADDPQKIQFLRQQLQDLPTAYVSTMHAFCSVELRRYHHYLDINPDYGILIAQHADKLRNQVFDELFDDEYETEDESFLSLIAAYGGNYNDEPVRAMVRSLVFMAEAKIDPEAWLEEIASSAALPVNQTFVSLFYDILNHQLDHMTEAIREMHDLVDGFEELQPYAETLTQDEFVYRTIKEQQSMSIEELISYLLSAEFVRLKPVSRKYKGEFEDEKERFKLLRESGLKEPLKLLQGLLPQGGWTQIKKDRMTACPYIKKAAQLAEIFLKRYAAVKRKKNVLDFSDLEHLMLTLLRMPEVLEHLKQEISYIFFDEYQDANPVQEEIVEMLASPGHLFFVGDVKQAIYRFRQADPALFNRRYHLYREQPNAGQLIHLAENFRSRQEILQFSNDLFETLMTPLLGEVDYRAPGQALVCGAEKAPVPDAVTIALIDQDDEELGKNDAEALWIAREVKRLVDEGKKSYSDIAILLRVPTSSLAAYQAALDQFEIPYYSDNSLVNFNNMEVRLFIDFLKVIDNDELDESLIAVLTSPFGGLADYELAAVRAAFPEGRFAQAMKNYQTSFSDGEISIKLREFTRRCDAYRLDLQMMTLTEFAERILNDSGFGDFLKSMENGEERYRNVCAFVDMIAEFETEDMGGLYAFLLHVDALKNRSNDNLQPAIALGQEDDCVRIMSIHKSKGLGFDTVFLGDITHQFNFRDGSAPLVLHPDYGAAPEIINVEQSTKRSSFEKRLLAQYMMSETKSEEVRLLYVALTRAVDRLYLVGADADMSKKLEKAQQTLLHVSLQKGRSFADWLYVLLGHAQIQSNHYVLQSLKTSDFSDGISDGEGIQRGALSLPYDENVLEQLQHTLSYEYPFVCETVEPYKKTVSQLSEENRLTDEVSGAWPPFEASQRLLGTTIPRPSFLSDALHFTAAEQGTIAHKAMQLLPLQAYSAESLEKALNGIVEKGLLSAQEAAAVDRTWILTFFDSSLGQDVLTHKKTVEREVPFTMFHDNHLVDGQIDLFYHTEEGYHIIDFKTDRKIQPDLYKLQLSLYEKALREARGEPVVGASIYWLRFAEISKVL